MSAVDYRGARHRLYLVRQIEPLSTGGFERGPFHGVFRCFTPEVALLETQEAYPETRRVTLLSVDLSAWLRMLSWESAQVPYLVYHPNGELERGAWDYATCPLRSASGPLLLKRTA